MGRWEISHHTFHVILVELVGFSIGGENLCDVVE